MMDEKERTKLLREIEARIKRELDEALWEIEARIKRELDEALFQFYSAGYDDAKKELEK